MSDPIDIVERPDSPFNRPSLSERIERAHGITEPTAPKESCHV